SKSQRLTKAQPSPPDPLVEGLALDILHHDEIDTVARADIMQRDDVGVIQGRCGLCLLRESPFAIRVHDRLCEQHLDCNKAVKVCVSSFVARTHAALAELLGNLVVQETLSDHTLCGAVLSLRRVMCRSNSSARLVISAGPACGRLVGDS